MMTMTSPTTGPGMRSRMRAGRARLAALVAVPLLLTGCDVGPGEEAQELPSATLDADAAEASGHDTGDGWVVRQNAGFTVETPADWHVPPEEHRFTQAALHVEQPFTGQAYAPPRLLAFLERGAVGDLATRESILRALLTSQLPEGATLGDTEQVEVDGAVAAVQFEATYTTSDETSYLDTTLRGTTFRQIELLVDTEGSPKLGFRFSVPEKDFDEAEWERIRDSIQVRPEELRERSEEARGAQG